MDFDSVIAAADGLLLDALKKADGVLYTPQGGGAPVTIRAIFDDRFAPAELGRVGMEATAPRLFVKLSDLPDDPATTNPTFTIDAKTYRVVSVQPGGYGAAVIILEES